MNFLSKVANPKSLRNFHKYCLMNRFLRIWHHR